ncbi:uncharacterized protein MELLADRAFT_124223 [Melampsora larici-populina 98AG31]|uniref:Secreted protein n=1 Tax=Melampsora larici-populina (strain 98AG31 / pathotype 3-4-7) TaxID=747676 RepID=F4S144_MELLP|nr:uncharacterized protein MELLADRAFT_124223 [Melampsora larici-populina 98AG31]EGG01633.1 secreted protein [Melampsora larici-populina 98AG31]
MYLGQLLIVCSTLLGLGICVAPLPSYQNCRRFYGPTKDGKFACQNSGGKAYTCSPAKQHPRLPMTGCVPYADPKNLKKGVTNAAPVKKDCDAAIAQKEPGPQGKYYIDCAEVQIVKDKVKLTAAYKCEIGPYVGPLKTLPGCILNTDQTIVYDIGYNWFK